MDLKAGIIVDVEATPALRTDEVNSTRTMIDRVKERFDMKPTRLVGQCRRCLQAGLAAGMDSLPVD